MAKFVGTNGRADQLFGGGENDVLNGKGSDDSLFGGTGDDTLLGGSGGDVLDGGRGNDWAWYSAGGISGVIADLFESFRNTGDARDDSYKSIENLQGTKLDDYLGGNEAANILVGRGGDDFIDGREGEDTIFGGNGDDTLITDGAFDDVFYAGTGDDLIQARGGDDTLFGDLGADTLNGGAGIDTASYFNAKEGAGIDLVKAQNIDGAAEGDTYANIENVVATKFDDYVGGNEGNNQIEGLRGDDVIDGRGGDNTLFGDSGNDTLIADRGDDVFYGGTGDDVLRSRDGDDTLIGGMGDDTLFGGQGADVFGYNGYNGYNGNDGNDVIEGFDPEDDVLMITGLDFGDGPGQVDPEVFLNANGTIDGDDALLSLPDNGSVRLKGIFDGVDSPDLSVLVPSLVSTSPQIPNGAIVGTSSNDIVRGTLGDDTLFGLSGDDILVPGSGDDVMFGGAGRDRFDLEPAQGNLAEGDKVIEDFVIGEDLFFVGEGLADNLPFTPGSVDPDDVPDIKETVSSFLERFGRIEGDDLILSVNFEPGGPLNGSADPARVRIENVIDEDEYGDEPGDYFEVFF